MYIIRLTALPHTGVLLDSGWWLARHALESSGVLTDVSNVFEKTVLGLDNIERWSSLLSLSKRYEIFSLYNIIATSKAYIFIVLVPNYF